MNQSMQRAVWTSSDAIVGQRRVEHALVVRQQYNGKHDQQDEICEAAKILGKGEGSIGYFRVLREIFLFWEEISSWGLRIFLDETS